MVDVTISYKGKQFCKNNPGRFVYTQVNESSIDFLFMRLSKAVPKYPGDPHGMLSKVIDIIDKVQSFFLHFVISKM